MTADLSIQHTDLPGLLILRHRVQHNDDGWFKENWHREKMVALGLPDFQPIQHNVTHLVSRGITRGFYAEPWDRLVSVVQGRVMGAWVDLREGDGFGRILTADLNRGTSVFVPRGVAHAHQVIEDHTTLNYLLEHHWTPQARNRYGFINLFDPALGITWPIGADQATVAHRDTLLPRLADAKPVAPRRILVAGVETRLGRAVQAEVPGSVGLTTAELALDAARQVDLSAFDTIINAYGETGSGIAEVTPPKDSWTAAAERAHRLTDIARRHGLRYVHISADCAFEHDAAEHDEKQPLSLLTTHSQALAAGEIIAAGVARHLVIRTGWVIGQGDGFIEDLAAAARRGESRRVLRGQFGRLTFAGQLAAGITHLLDRSAPSGVYNVTGDGKVTTWADIAHRVFQISGGDPRNIRESEPSTSQGGNSLGSVLSLEKLKSTGFRPGNSWLELSDHVPKTGVRARPNPFESGGDSSVAPPRRDQPYRVLFVCTANICRSAYADVVARHDVLPAVQFSSAGIQALVGHAIDPPMAHHVGGRGDAQAHKARQLTRDMVMEADLILTMGPDHRRYILDEWPTLGRKAFVIGHAARVLKDLPPEVALDGLVDHLWRHRTPNPGDEVADPYRRGPAAAETAAQQIDSYIATINAVLGRLS